MKTANKIKKIKKIINKAKKNQIRLETKIGKDVVDIGEFPRCMVHIAKKMAFTKKKIKKEYERLLNNFYTYAEALEDIDNLIEDKKRCLAQCYKCAAFIITKRKIKDKSRYVCEDNCSETKLLERLAKNDKER